MSFSIRNSVLLLIALGLAALYLFPLYWMYVTSLKSSAELFVTPPKLWPDDPNWGTYIDVWVLKDMGTYLWNSSFIALGTTGLTIVLGIGAAYVLSRYQNIWIDVSLFVILMLQVLPQSLMVTPLFVGFSQLGMLDSPRIAVILALTAKTMPLFVILCRATFLSVPRELEEAALVDGNSRIGSFISITLPLARNGILVVGILIFMQSFGEYVYSKSIIQSAALQPATVGLSSFMGPNANDWTRIMSFSAIYVTPILALFVLLQRHIVSGLTSGALK